MLKTHALSLNFREKYLVKNISLNFSPGQIYGIMGPNGSGKTTLLKLLTGIWKASSGKIYWGNQDLMTLDRKSMSRILSLVPQNPQVQFDFSVAEIVEMGTYPRQELKAIEKKNLVQWALELVDAWHLSNQRATEISHGERQRMYIARSLVTQSPVLMLDEPTSNLDIKHQLDIWSLLKRLAHENKLIIVANHDLQTTERFCDQMVILNQGICVQQGSYSEVMTQEMLRSVFGVSEVPFNRQYTSDDGDQ